MIDSRFDLEYPFHDAVRRDDHDYLRFFINMRRRGYLAFQYNINLQDYGTTPLHIAVKGRRIECVRLLLEAGAKANIENCLGRTPVDEAAGMKNTEMVMMFIKRGYVSRSIFFVNFKKKIFRASIEDHHRFF